MSNLECLGMKSRQAASGTFRVCTLASLWPAVRHYRKQAGLLQAELT
jgi:hypothetical protein